MYATVPTSSSWAAESAPGSRTTPKSMSFAVPSSSTKMFDGVTSRCTSPRRWMCSSALAICTRIFSARRKRSCGEISFQLSDDLLELAPAEVLHRVVRAIPRPPALDHAQDVGMGDPGKRVELALEPLHALGAHPVREHDLEREPRPGRRVDDVEHVRHAPVAELAFDLEPGDALAACRVCEGRGGVH
jgi:hypothetical protein